MKPTSAMQTKRFHGYLDTDVTYWMNQVIETKETRYVVVQEREVSYRIFLHQHPYVQQLAQRLVRKGISGLQAADTEYAPHDASLPGSIQITLDGTPGLSIPGGSTLALLADTPAADSGGVPISLSAGTEVQLAAATPVTFPDGLQAMLADGMTNTPAKGEAFTLPRDEVAILFGDTKITLATATAITLHDGTPATTTDVVQAMLAGGTSFSIPNGTQATLLKSQPLPVLYADIFSPAAYSPSSLVEHPYPVKDLDFTSSGAYAVYNWELFFHVPLTIAIHLSKNQRFAEAQRWFHYLFDPTDDSDGPTPERFWKVRPFQTTDVKKIEEILVNLATGGDETLRKETIHSIDAWKAAPFRPHVIARFRQQAYMIKTVMAYLDNLIAWGDSLFRQDTGEAIDEALMLYVLAANILGPRPQPVPKKGSVRPQTYANLRKDLKQFGTVMRDMEADLPFDLMPFPTDDDGNDGPAATLRDMGRALYFCVPRNDKLLSYWDTVADRLFKIRNSLNIQGTFRQLALFEPPIDPAMLARAAAAGLDVGAIVNGLNQPLPLVRFQLLAQKAAEICQEVKTLGNSLLSAMEKGDGEALAILRAKHERAVLEMIEHVRYAQVQEAIKSKEALSKSLALAVQRYTYYEQQLGKKIEDITKAIPALDELKKEELDALYNMSFSVQEPEISDLRPIDVDIAQDLNDSGGKIMSSFEAKELSASHSARDWQVRASVMETTASLSHYVPKIGVDLKPIGVGGHVEFGGDHIGAAFKAIAEYQRSLGSQDSYDATHASKMSAFQRREQDWALQSNLAAGEINQIFKQLRAAQLREAIAGQELANLRQQITQAKEVESFLNEEGTEKTGKRTNKAFYVWMNREVKGLYGQCFQFAFDIARKAERALQHELGNPELSYLQFGYLAGKEGLLAGEKLYLDIKRMEMAYHELNQREYELTKHVSLLQVDPLALIELRTTGRCRVQIPEEMFDMDGPGHYFRRIKTVALSIPCVTGPYVSVNCTLTMLKSSIRTAPILQDDKYPREDAEDSRFNDYYGSLQSIVTSSAQNDSGLFETNLRDERYLPFEHAGVISEWQLQLPANPSKDDPRQFDYDTISDVILHIRYTAREGGDLLRKAAMKHLTDGQAVGATRLFSIRQEFPTEWAQFQGAQPSANSRYALALNLRKEHYPFWSQGRLKSMKGLEILARSTEPAGVNVVVKDSADATAYPLEADNSLGKLLRGQLDKNGFPASPVGPLKLYFDSQALSDVWIALTWSAT